MRLVLEATISIYDYEQFGFPRMYWRGRRSSEKQETVNRSSLCSAEQPRQKWWGFVLNVLLRFSGQPRAIARAQAAIVLAPDGTA
jgi:hypothetical protein